MEKHSSTYGYYGIFNDSFPPILDGVTLTVENYVKYLQKSGRTPCVVTPWNPDNIKYEYKVMKYFSLPIFSRRPYRYGYPKADMMIWRRLRNTPFKIVHCHCPFSSGRLGVYVKKHQNVPLIGTFHSKYRSDLEHSFPHSPWMVSLIMKRILNFFNSCDEVWIPQAAVEETVREYGFKGKLHVMENGSDMELIIGNDLDSYRSCSKKMLGIPDDTISLLFVGQHIWEKGIGMILDSLLKLKGKVKFQMNFVGTGYAFDDISNFIKSHGLSDCVKLNGVIKGREAISRYYAAADLFLFPSAYDNAPLVVREAAAAGVPSILLRGSTASEVIRDNENGLLVSDRSDELAAAVKSLSEDREKMRRIGLGAKATLVRHWEDIVAEAAYRYDLLVEKNRKNGKG